MRMLVVPAPPATIYDSGNVQSLGLNKSEILWRSESEKNDMELNKDPFLPQSINPNSWGRAH